MRDDFREFKIQGYTIRQLNMDDADILQDLCGRCVGNNNIIIGSSRDKNESRVILTKLPEGKLAEDKTVLGLFERDFLIGVLDMVRDFPVKGELILGLLMIDPDVTGRGLRGKMHSCVINWARRQGFQKLRIDVTAENEESLEFWENIGYYEISRVNIKAGGRFREVVIMNYKLEPMQ